MVEGFFEWTEQVGELTDEMQVLIADLYGFMSDAKMFAVIVAIVVILLFIFVIAEHTAIRRLEGKIDMLISSEVEVIESED